MKKLLIITLIILLVILLGYIGIQGFEIGPVKILGITGIQAKNTELNMEIEKTTKLASNDYKKAVADIDTSVQKLEKEKKSYEDMVTISTSDDIKIANQLEKYEVEYLWTKVGNHATSEGVTLKMDITNGSGGITTPTIDNNQKTENIQNQDNGIQETEDVQKTHTVNTDNMAVGTQSESDKLYNLNFTVTGSYIAIADFIYSIENDSSLAFKIEQFKMLPSGGNELKATFVCKDIAIKDISQASTGGTENKEQANNTTNNTTTNNTTTNNTTNNTTTNSTTTNNTTNNTTNPNAR